jgi:uncharacterized protein YbjT (DUF2867 family)
MKYVITGSLGHIGKPLAIQLTEAGHTVTVITSHPERSGEIESLGAVAAIGTVEDARFLSDTFKGADAVYTMVPPNYGGNDWKGFIGGIGKAYVKAIMTSGVTHVVNLSSIGAHMPSGCGPVSGLYRVEQAMNALPGVHVHHLRAGYFYTNFLNSIGMIRQHGIMGGNFGQNTLIVLVHPTDIADAAASKLQDPSFTGKGFRYIASDEKHTDEIASILGQAIGKPELKWVDRSDQEMLDGMISSGMSAEIARNYTEMGAALRSGEMSSDYEANRPILSGWRRFETFAPEFATAWSAS